MRRFHIERMEGLGMTVWGRTIRVKSQGGMEREIPRAKGKNVRRASRWKLTGVPARLAASHARQRGLARSQQAPRKGSISTCCPRHSGLLIANSQQVFTFRD